jgi:group I intron endonuclease
MIGIYLIKNISNQKRYIGSSLNVDQRRRRHFKDLRKNAHGNRLLQRAYNKYGEKTFKFSLLEILITPQNLIEREQYWINSFNPEYNISPTAGNSLGVKHRPEAIEKNRKRNSGFGNGNAKITKELADEIIKELDIKTPPQVSEKYGVHLTTIFRLIKRMGYKYTRKYSEEAIKKMKSPRPNAKIANKRKVAMVDKSGKIIKKYESCRQAGKDINRVSSGITQSIKDNYLCGGHKFIYLE